MADDITNASLEQFNQLARQRKSIRFFGAKPVERELVLKFIDIANQAPSVDNTKPWHFHVIYNRDLRRQLMETSCYGNFVEGSGVFLLVTCDKKAKQESNRILWNPKELEYSCVGAITHVLLAATSAGIASCWVSLHHGHAAALLKLPKTHAIIGGVMLGYPRKYDDERMLPVGPAKPPKAMYTIHE